ncbi:PhoPQ-activated pathogenicity-related family protein [Leadbetterella byssophila]|uniref:PhoPQ-activated pathogenicity-related family protein n=1 Tax=Leadbetterella byssophila TaxID=316068 RepID=UPI0039A3BDAE
MKWLKALLIFWIPCVVLAQTPETALKSYIENGDKTYKWEIKDTHTEKGVTRYNVLLTSQKWREFVWKHQLTVFVPEDMAYDGALLFITGGSVKNGEPNWSDNDDRYWPVLSAMAKQNKAVTAIIKQVPNQPIIGTMTEDELISYTLHQFKKDKDYSWPLLFPMVKSAVRGLDAIQDLVMEKNKKEIKRFVISGASKRGWTTWLSSAIDDSRVVAIAPMVIDMLNMPETLNYQYKTYGEYSIQIEDYTKLGIAQDISSADGKALQAMIDPYSYRSKLKHPKMIFIGTNDEYWTLDAIKFSWDEIPGTNMIHLVPNAGHDLGGGAQAFEALNGFFATTLQNKPYPVPKWKVQNVKGGTEISIDAPRDGLMEASLWYTSSSDKDFRNNFWQKTRVKIGEEIKMVVPNPQKGYHGFYIDLKYKNPSGGTYLISTRAFISDKNGLQP